MKTILVYPMPCESEEALKTFLPHAEKFADTYLFYTTTEDQELIVVCNGADPTDEVRKIFEPCNATFERYDGAGFDLGSQQFIAKQRRNSLQINFTSRCYFHRPDWLWKMIVAFEAYGDGLYGCSASREGGRLHVCTRAFMYWTETFRNFPREITSRDQGVGFEVGSDGEPSLTEWYASLKLPRKIVHPHRLVDVDKFDTVHNRFRNGDQSNMLVFDRHSDLYHDADAEEKKRLEDMVLGVNKE